MTETSYVTITQTATGRVTCAKLVNVTGPCRRRRGIWIEEPIVISFDDDVDAAAQFLFSSPVFE